MEYPTAFSNPLAKWVRHKCSESLFFVMVEPKGNRTKAITSRVNTLNILPVDKREEICNQTSYCTGFVVERKADTIKILTSAHCIEHMFSASNPISAQEVRELFSFQILCEHYEMTFRQSRKRDKVRSYCPARVVDIDCRRDLLLLQIDERNILLFNGNTCTHDHEPLHPAFSPPNELETAVMVSWPPRRPRTSAVGEISHCQRDYSDESAANPHGYGMSLVEVNIPGQDGSSGAPLLDGSGRYIGLFHGGEKDCYSCFVSLPDIVYCLNRWGVELR